MICLAWSSYMLFSLWFYLFMVKSWSLCSFLCDLYFLSCQTHHLDGLFTEIFVFFMSYICSSHKNMFYNFYSNAYSTISNDFQIHFSPLFCALIHCGLFSCKIHFKSGQYKHNQSIISFTGHLGLLSSALTRLNTFFWTHLFAT